MTILLSITDTDIFPEEIDVSPLPIEPPFEKEENRKSARIIAFDKNKKLALVGIRYKLIPGGGVEEGETYEQAAIRESREEIGCAIKIEREIGITKEHRRRINRHQETHCFLASVIGEKGLPETIQEDEQGIQVHWFTLENAIAELEKQLTEIPYKSYHSCFNVRTHLAFLKELQKTQL